ncbi:TonB-dependent siderophore receptor [Pseudomonas sp. StFLB209]|nr:TonB-dependent siderophore receptor [Pseudomonas sp. StFLB209]
MLETGKEAGFRRFCGRRGGSRHQGGLGNRCWFNHRCRRRNHWLRGDNNRGWHNNRLYDRCRSRGSRFRRDNNWRRRTDRSDNHRLYRRRRRLGLHRHNRGRRLDGWRYNHRLNRGKGSRSHMLHFSSRSRLGLRVRLD